MKDKKRILISGASFAGLATAFWMKRLGYDVTVVEIAPGLRRGGTPVNIRENTVEVMRRMGLLEPIRLNGIHMESVAFKNADDVTVGLAAAGAGLGDGGLPAKEEYEVERDFLVNLIFDELKNDVEFIFSDTIASLEDNDIVDVVFNSGVRRHFHLVFGCDGIHSVVRRLCFGDESKYMHFLNAYFSITIVRRLLIKENTMEIYNEPGRVIILNAYNNKTDIVLCFAADEEICYDYRDEAQQRQIILDRFSTQGWRTRELLDELDRAKTFYFDKLCQIKMPSWSKGRIVLVGDAGYCPSPAAGAGGSLALDGAAALADAFQTCGDDYSAALQAYEKSFRPFIEAIQADAVDFGLNFLLPRTAEAIHARNTQAAFP